MRILTVCSGLGLGGTERAAQNFTLSYARAGHTTAILSLNGGGIREAHFQAANVPVFIGTTDHSLAAAKAFQADFIHIHRPGMTDPAFLAAVAAVKSPHSVVAETNVFGRVDRSAESNIIDVHFHLSRWCLWRWKKWGGRSLANRIGVVIPYAVSTRDFYRSSAEAIDAFHRQLSVPPEARLIGRVGQKSEGKWHPTNITAFAEVAKTDARLHLLLVGLPDSYKRHVDSLPADIRQRVHVLDLIRTDQGLRDFYSSLDCFLHAANIGESFGLVLTEAMLCGCPVVTASRPHKDNSQLEVVGHRQGGLIAASVDSLGTTLRELLSDEPLRARISAHSAEWVRSRFDADLVAARALRVAEHALNNPDPARRREAICADPEIECDVPDRWIRELLKNVSGKATLGDRVKFRIRQSQLVQKMSELYLKHTLYRRIRKARQAKKKSL